MLCERQLHGLPGQRVGLSLGGGGTGKEFCRDRKCITEQDQGVIQSNLIAACSDDGIYLNSAAGSQIVHNTLLDTAGIDVRFAGPAARDLDGNLVDGAIRSRNDGVLHLGENLATPTGCAVLWLPSGAPACLRRPGTRAWMGSGAATPARRQPRRCLDLCGGQRPALAALGAFEDFAACRRALAAR